MAKNEKENYILNYKRNKWRFSKISQVIHSEFEKIANHKICIIDNILSNIYTVLIHFTQNQNSNNINNYDPLF